MLAAVAFVGLVLELYLSEEVSAVSEYPFCSVSTYSSTVKAIETGAQPLEAVHHCVKCNTSRPR